MHGAGRGPLPGEASRPRAEPPPGEALRGGPGGAQHAHLGQDVRDDVQAALAHRAPRPGPALVTPTGPNGLDDPHRWGAGQGETGNQHQDVAYPGSSSEVGNLGLAGKRLLAKPPPPKGKWGVKFDTKKN